MRFICITVILFLSIGADAYYGQFSQLLVLNRGVHEPLKEYVFQELLKNLPKTPLMIELGALLGPLFDVDKEIAAKVDNNLGRT